MAGKDLAVDIDKLGAVAGVINSLSEVRLRKLDLAEGLHTIGGSPTYVYVGLFVRCWHGFRLPSGEYSILAKGPE